MKVLGVAGPSDSATSAAIEAIATQLSARGRVATVEIPPFSPDLNTTRDEILPERVAGAGTSVIVSDDDRWVATGQGRTVEDTLADLASDHEYALVAGDVGGGLPSVALGDVDPGGPVLVRASAHEDLDVDDVLDAIEDVEPFVTLESLVAEAKRSERADRAGAIATFTGRVREREGPDDEPTEHLEFERYDEVAEQRLETIREELEAREGVYEVLAYHKTGVVEAGEDIVFVVVLAGHREEAFETVSDGIDRLKAEVPLFKKEVTVDDEFWRHERPSG